MGEGHRTNTEGEPIEKKCEHEESTGTLNTLSPKTKQK